MDERAVVVLHPKAVVTHWATIKELLAPAMEFTNGELEVEDVLTLVTDGKAFLFGAVEAGRLLWVAACECVSYPQRTVLNVIAVGGRHLNTALSELWSEITGIAHTLGATAVRGAVRPSMERYFRRFAPDARKAYVVMERMV